MSVHIIVMKRVHRKSFESFRSKTESFQTFFTHVSIMSKNTTKKKSTNDSFVIMQRDLSEMEPLEPIKPCSFSRVPVLCNFITH